MVNKIRSALKTKSVSNLLTSILLVLLIGLIFPLISISVYAEDEVEVLQKQIDELNKARTLSEAATKPLEGQLGSLKNQLVSIQKSLQTLSAKITQKEKDVQDRT